MGLTAHWGKTKLSGKKDLLFNPFYGLTQKLKTFSGLTQIKKIIRNPELIPKH